MIKDKKKGLKWIATALALGVAAILVATLRRDKESPNRSIARSMPQFGMLMMLKPGLTNCFHWFSSTGLSEVVGNEQVLAEACQITPDGI